MLKMLRWLAMWILWNVPVGKLAPHLLGFALGSKPTLKDK